MLDKMKSLWQMQQKMQELKRQMDTTDIVVESADKQLKVVMNGSQEVKEIKIKGPFSPESRGSLEAGLKDTVNKAIKRSQQIAAEKMKEIAVPGLSGLL